MHRVLNCQENVCTGFLILGTDTKCPLFFFFLRMIDYKRILILCLAMYSTHLLSLSERPVVNVIFLGR